MDITVKFKDGCAVYVEGVDDFEAVDKYVAWYDSNGEVLLEVDFTEVLYVQYHR